MKCIDCSCFHYKGGDYGYCTVDGMVMEWDHDAGLCKNIYKQEGCVHDFPGDNMIEE